MKSPETDKGLFDLVKDTLDNYEEQYVLGSWENFVRTRKKRKRIFFWLTATGIAASVLIGWIGFSLLQNGSVENINDVLSYSDTRIPSSSGDHGLTYVPSAKTDSIFSDNSITDYYKPEQEIFRNEYGFFSGREDERISLPVHEKEVYSEIPRIVIELKGYDPLSDQSAGLSPSSGPVAGNSLYTGRILASFQGIEKPEAEEGDIALPADDIREIPVSGRLRVGVGIASGLSMANAVPSAYFSGGISADYRLTGNFRISAGMQVEQQNVMNTDTDSPAWIPPAEVRARFVDIDIPVNLTWQFMARKSTTYYISGGVSSVLYLSEKYSNTSYTQRMVPTVEATGGDTYISYRLENVPTVEESEAAPLSAFDLAGRINIIFGFEYKLSGKLFLQVEPYLKLPVTDLASQNIRFTSSGLSCRIAF